MRLPEAVRVWLATFADVDSASDAVSAIIAAGIVPTALEMMDAVATRAVEAAFPPAIRPTRGPCCSSNTRDSKKT